MPTRRSAPAIWCGAGVSAETVSVYDRSGTFEAVTRPGFDTIVIAVDEHHMAEVRQLLDLPDWVGTQGAEINRCPPAQLDRIRARAQRILRAPWADASLWADAALSDELQYELVGELLTSLCSAEEEPRMSFRVRDEMLDRAREFLGGLGDEFCTVQQLCHATGASERTLRRAFVDHFGVPPKAYLQARRLNSVRRELLQSDPVATKVADVANRCGFWHMGQFAADYRGLFGELPSETLRLNKR